MGGGGRRWAEVGGGGRRWAMMGGGGRRWAVMGGDVGWRSRGGRRLRSDVKRQLSNMGSQAQYLSSYGVMVGVGGAG